MTVYLIHLDRPIGNLSNSRGQARHYLGCTNNLSVRMQQHRAGNGAHLLRAAQEQGVGWQVVRCWRGGWAKEKALKRCHNLRRYCPVCNPYEGG